MGTDFNGNLLLEEWHWWYIVRRKIIKLFLLQNENDYNNKTLLDIGCGSGVFLNTISNNFQKALGIESFEYNEFKYNNIKHGTIFDESLIDGKYDYITALDVIEHIEDEDSFLDRVKSLLHINGKVLLTVPAYQWLYCKYDKEAGHYRRYNKKQIKNLMEKNGFIVENITYFNTFLFPVFVPIRLISSLLIKTSDNNKKIQNIDKSSSLSNIIPYKIFNFEYKLLGGGDFKIVSIWFKCIDKMQIR